MAMTASQYLATLPPAEQQQVQASLAASGSSLDQWFQAAIDAGDPRAVKAAGGSAAEEAEGGIADYASAAPSSEWLGVRKPTPREARRYYAEQKRPEDFKRYDDRQLADWINNHWDVAAGGFVGANGGLVDKPTETGGALDPYARGGAPKGGGGGGAAAPATPAAQAFNDPLQSRLLEMLQGGEGNFAGSRAVGRDLEGGGVWWSPTDANKLDTPMFNSPLTTATLTAFSPNAPSAQRASASERISTPVNNAPVNSAATGEIARPTQPTVPGVTPTPPQLQPNPVQGDILPSAVQRRFRDPSRWWAGGNPR